jgi:hypothetical protein
MNQVKGEEGKETCLGCAKVLWHLWKQKASQVAKAQNLDYFFYRRYPWEIQRGTHIL